MRNIQLFKFFDHFTRPAFFQSFAPYWELEQEAEVKKCWKPT